MHSPRERNPRGNISLSLEAFTYCILKKNRVRGFVIECVKFRA